MYLTILAEQLDVLAAQAGVHINEDDRSVTASNLSAKATLEIISACVQLGWRCSAFDEAQTPTNPSDINEDFEPFRINIRKPDTAADTLNIITEVGFLHWLDRGHHATNWRIACLKKPLVTLGRIYSDWSGSPDFTAAPLAKSPWTLVREPSAARLAPEDIRPWLLDQVQPDFNDRLHLLWACRAFDALVHSLANEIDSEKNFLIFRGPPKLRLALLQINTEKIQEFGAEAFSILQVAAHWVYENRREAEIKHTLLSTEIARSGREDGNVADYLKENLITSLESARIAYQMSLSGLAKDTLKSLGELRKAITEETAKATDATRQTVTAISGALAVGFGLVAARLSTNINPWLISLVMLVAMGYIAMILYSGWGFIRLQRELRREWQPKLYRFLPQEEYRKMVTIPAEKSETVFKCSALIGGVAVIILFLGVSIFSFFSPPIISITRSGHLQAPNSGWIAPVATTAQVKFLQIPAFQSANPFSIRKAWLSPLAVPVQSRSDSAKP